VLSTGDGQSSVEVLIYIAEKEDNVPLPSSQYRQLIIAGAKYWNIPEIYLLMLEQLQAATD
jgi:hypothetical protein